LRRQDGVRKQAQTERHTPGEMSQNSAPKKAVSGFCFVFCARKITTFHHFAPTAWMIRWTRQSYLILIRQQGAS
jgi:hypothetical protein